VKRHVERDHVSGFNFYDWRAHGTLDILHGFEHSSDIYFIRSPAARR